MLFLKRFITFVAMNKPFRVSIITHSEDLPPMTSDSFFHSTDLFRIVEKTPGQLPYMVIVWREEKIVAHMLATLRRRGAWIPPYLFTQGRVYGEGEYAEGEDKNVLFELMIKAITRKLLRRLCLYIEFSDLSQKMFGYRVLRSEGYFPVQWMEIHNSLHSLSPQERINEKMLQRIEHANESGVQSKEVETEEEFHARVNGLMRENNGDGVSYDSGSERWTIGPNGRDHGSVHSDVMEHETAASLASCDMIGVYPIGGWWKERSKFECYNRKVHYSLIVSLETEETDCDIYTPVANKIRARVPIEIQI